MTSGSLAEHAYLKAIQFKITKRMIPLYLAAFCQGFILWHAIEKLFMRDIGFSDGEIGLVVALASLATFLTEVPSGLLADRWSRKGVLILASVCLAFGSLIAGSTHNVPNFITAACLWGVFYAFYSGTYEAIVYDLLLEETGSPEHFETYFGRIKLFDAMALVASSLVGGLLATGINLRTPFLATILPALIGIVALVAFREPHLHKFRDNGPITSHFKHTFAAVLRSRSTLPLVFISILIAIIIQVIYEFDQLWLIALSAPMALFGVMNALTLSSSGIGGLLVNRIPVIHSPRNVLIALLLMLMSTLALTGIHNLPATIFALFVVSVTAATMGIVYSKLLHDELDSNIRASCSSVVSTLARIVIIPVALTFGKTSEHFGIFQAGFIVVTLVCAASLLIARTFFRRPLPVAQEE